MQCFGQMYITISISLSKVTSLFLTNIFFFSVFLGQQQHHTPTPPLVLGPTPTLPDVSSSTTTPPSLPGPLVRVHSGAKQHQHNDHHQKLRYPEYCKSKSVLMNTKSSNSPLRFIPTIKQLPKDAEGKDIYCVDLPCPQSPPPGRLVLLQPQQHLSPAAPMEGDKEKLGIEPENNNNIVNYKYFSQIETLKKRSIQPQFRFDQIMTNNETSLRATVYQSSSPTMAGQQQQPQQMQSSREPEEQSSCQDADDSVELKEEPEVDDSRPSSAAKASTPSMEPMNVAQYPPAYLKQYTDLKTDEALDAAIVEAAGACGNCSAKSPSRSANDGCEDLSAGYRRCDPLQGFGSLGPSSMRIDVGAVDNADVKDACADRFALGGELHAKDGSHGCDQTSVRSDEGYHSNGFHDDALTPPDGCVDSDDSDVVLDFR